MAVIAFPAKLDGDEEDDDDDDVVTSRRHDAGLQLNMVDKL